MGILENIKAHTEAFRDIAKKYPQIKDLKKEIHNQPPKEVVNAAF
jgi:hypothetical protein